MGFYGNVSNITRSTFQFDKIYSNRFTMDLNADTDNIYVGRYVLVEYDQESVFDVIQRVYIKSEAIRPDTFFYVNNESNSPTINGKKGKYYFVAKDNPLPDTKRPYDSVILIKCLEDGATKFENNPEDPSVQKVHGFEIVTNVETSLDNYSTNYRIDYDRYGNSRGYDSTVWMKSYVGDKIQYVNIAELNSVVPTFVVTGDAPSDRPVHPHFDADSTNVYYNLHLPTSWGLRVKEATNGKSDEQVTWNEMHLNIPNLESTNYPDIHKISVTRLQQIKSGAIYYNKAGFNVRKRSREDNVIDKIEITEGQSGNLYPSHDKTQQYKVQQNDIKELSIMLPSLGNTVSDMWDIVYGQERNLDIAWNSKEGLRMVIPDKEIGYWYNTDYVSTMAGVINSVHDLMGMIIDTEENMGTDAIILERKDVNNDNRQKYENGLAAANDSNIYYSNKNKEFYIKEVTYDYTIADENSPAIGYEKMNLSPWEANKYYYKVSEKQYNLDTSPKATYGRQYYTVTSEKVNVADFEQNKYFNKINNNYNIVNNIADANSAISTGSLYTLNPQKKIEPNKTEFYLPNTYYYLVGETLTPDSNATKGNRDYYKLTLVIENGNIVLDENGQVKMEARQIDLINFEPNKYYILGEDNSYVVLTAASNKKMAYTLSPEKVEYSGFYYQNNNPWWYKEQNKFIKMDLATLGDKANSLYTITSAQVTKTFYIPGYYYYEIINEKGQNKKVIDYSAEKQDVEYWTYNGLYVIDDSLNHYTKGAQWLYDYKDKPDTLTLGTRQIAYQWKKLEGFAHNYNTIHGLIVSINNLIKKSDTLTRDNQTVQGAINTLNDIIGKFEDFEMSNLLMVNNYGQVVTSQVQQNRWVSNIVDGTVGEQFIEFAHKYRDTTSYSGSRDESSSKTNMDFADIAGNKGTYVDSDLFDSSYASDKNKSKSNQPDSGINGTNDDTLKIYTPVIDATGHVVGRNLETVTLPYGFRDVKVINSSGNTNTTLLSSTVTTKVSADTSQDTFSIENGNVWIRLSATDNTSNNIKIYHEIHNLKTNDDITTINLTSANPQTFELHQYSFDDAGHLDGTITTTVSVPNNYGIFTTTTGTETFSTVASGTQGTMTINGSNNIDIIINQDTITISHTAAQTSNILTTLDSVQNPNFGDTFNIPVIDYDGNGHISSVTTNTVQIPQPSLTTNGTGNVVTDLSLTNSSGTFTTAKANVGTLLLTDYIFNTEVEQTTITDTDSINLAFSKLELALTKALTRIEELEKAMGNLTKGNDDDSISIEVPESFEETND